MSTRSSNSCPKAIAGAGLRIVVAPTARARFEERGDGGQRDFKLADSDVAFGEKGAADVLCIHQSVGAGHDDNGVVGIGKGDDGGSGVRLGRLLDEGEVYALRGEKRLCFPSE